MKMKILLLTILAIVLKLNHYVNHMIDGYKYSHHEQYAEGQSSFYAALSINPGDNTAIKALRNIQFRARVRNLI